MRFFTHRSNSRLLLVAAAAATMLVGPAHAQGGAIIGTVVAAESGERLAYANIVAPTLQHEDFANDSGEFRLGNLQQGRLELRIRRLGFQPATIIVHVLAGETQRIDVVLRRLAITLDQVVVRSWPPCRAPGAPSAEADPTFAAIFEQLRLNAAQYRLLSRQYPYTYTMTSTLTHRRRGSDRLELSGRNVLVIHSAARWDYKPGEVIRRRGRSASFRIPTLAELSDDRFVSAHCFHYAGLDMVDSVEMLRIDLVAAESIDAPDVNGSMYLDRQSFQVRRTVLFLTGRDDRLRHLAEMRVTTDFGEIIPSIPIVVEVNSVQVIDPEVKGDLDEAYETQSLIDFRFRGRKPGGQ